MSEKVVKEIAYWSVDLNLHIGEPPEEQLRFALESILQVPHFFFIGDQDDNDSVPSDDGFDDEDKNLIFDLFGQTPIERWPFAQELYESIDANVVFTVYVDVGHTLTPEMLDDVRAFFEEALME